MVSRLLKNVLVWSLGVFAAVLLLASLLVYLRSNAIKQAVANAVNSHIETRFTYTDFDLSIISTFPFILARMDEVHLTGNNGLPFIHAKELEIRLDIRALFRNEVDLRSIKLSGGTIYIIEKKDCSPNYDIFRTGGGNQRSLDLLFRDLEMKDMVLVLDLPKVGNRHQKYVASLRLKGGFKDEILDLAVETVLVSDYMRAGEHVFLENREIQLEGKLNYQPGQSLLYIPSLKWKSGTLMGNVNGQVQFNSGAYSFSGRIDRSPVKELLKVAGLFERTPTQVFISSGYAEGNFSISGKTEEEAETSANIDLSGGNCEWINRGIKFGNIAGKVEWTQNKTGNSTLRFTDFKSHLDGNPTQWKLFLEDLGEEAFLLELSGEFDAETLAKFNSDLKGYELRDGALSVEFLRAEGKYGKDNGLQLDHLQGSLFLKDISAYVLSEAVKLEEGHFSLLEDGILVAGLRGCSALDASFEGGLRIFDLVDILTEKSGKGKSFRADLNLDAEKIDLGRFLAFLDEWKDFHSPGEDDPANSGEAERDLHMDIQLFSRELNWRRSSFENLNGMLTMRPEGGIFSGQGRHASGEFDVDGFFQLDGLPSLSIRLTANELAVDELFSQWDNFGQTTVKSENLNGKLQGHLKALLKWKADGDLDRDHSELIAAVELENGMLKNFEMLQAFSGFVHEETLNSIQFEKLSNVFWMRNGSVYLPELFLHNNAVNITVSGAHTLDQQFRYGIQLNAGQVMAERIGSRNPRQNAVPARRNGFFNLHYLLQGDADDFSYRTDQRAVLSIFDQTTQMKADALEKLLDSFGDLPLFSGDTRPDEPPELPTPGQFEDEEPIYMEGFGRGT
jgi:hypothetical protein